MMLAQVRIDQAMTDFNRMTSDERLEMFIQATDYLRQQGIYYKQMAEAIGSDYKRIKSMRSQTGPNVKPTIEELDALFEAFPDRLTGFKQMLGEPSPEEQKLMSLEERIEALEKENEIARKELLRKLALLEAENELLRKKLKK